MIEHVERMRVNWVDTDASGRIVAAAVELGGRSMPLPAEMRAAFER